MKNGGKRVKAKREMHDLEVAEMKVLEERNKTIIQSACYHVTILN